MKKIDILLLLLLIVIQVNAQTKFVTLEKSGSLQSSIGKDTQFTNLVIKGEFNDKDLDYVTTLSFLQCLDLSQAVYPKKLKEFPILNVKELYLPNNGFMPYYLVDRIAACPNLETLSTPIPCINGESALFPSFQERLKKIIFTSKVELNPKTISDSKGNLPEGDIQEIDTITLPLSENIPDGFFVHVHGFRPKYVVQNGVAYLLRSENLNEILNAEALSPDERMVLPYQFPAVVELRNTKIVTNKLRYIRFNRVTIKSNQLQQINEGAFEGSSLRELIIECDSEKPVIIQKNAFKGCQNLKKIVLNCNTVIEEEAFNTGGTIESVTFNGYAKIKDKAFGNINVAVFNAVPQYITEHFAEIPGQEKILCSRIQVPAGKIDTFVRFGLPKSILVDSDEDLKLSITLENGGTILNKIPIDKLSQIKSLKIVGIVYETDLKILNKCKNLETLDLGQAFTTLSPEEWNRQKTNQAILSGLFGLMGQIVDQQYNNDETTTTQYVNSKIITELLKSATEVESSDPGCIIAREAISGLYNLQTLILPYRCKSILSYNFTDCPNLTKIQWPMYLEVIDDGCFQNTGLKEVILPASVSHISWLYTFNHCSSLEKVDFSKCAVGNGEWRIVFKNCKALKELHFSRDVKRIIDAPNVEGCTFYIPANVTFFSHFFSHQTLHFKGNTAPTARDFNHNFYPRDCKIYVPKGCLTSYYSSYGDSNTYVEE